MFGTMGVSELIIILVIFLIIFGAGRLPQIGEGIGKALKGFKKEVHEVPPPEDANAPQEPPAVPASPPQPASNAPVPPEGQTGQPADKPVGASPTNTPYVPGPEATPGTTAALLYTLGPQKPAPVQAQPSPASSQAQSSGAAPVVSSASYAPPPTMEDRVAQPSPGAQASYPALPPQARMKAPTKRPSAVVNKDAVARVQAKQAAMRQAVGQKPGGVSSQDMQSLGEGLGEALRTFREAAADVRGAIEPQMRTIQTEMDSAQKEIEQSVEAAKQIPAAQEDPPQSS